MALTFLTVQPVKNLVATGNNLSTSTEALTGTETGFTFGGSSNLAGASWSYSDINSANFGVIFRFNSTTGTSSYLRATNFGFSIPSHHNIVGIQFTIYASGTGIGTNSASVRVNYVRCTITTAIASSGDEVVRPISNINSSWNTNSFANIDDPVLQPAAGSGDVCGCNETQFGNVQQWGLSSPESTGTISAAKIWCRAITDSNEDGTISSCRIRLNGTWYTGTQISFLNGGSYSWAYWQFTGSYGPISGSLPAVELTYNGASPDSLVEVDVVYAELTYGPSGSPSSSSKFLMFFN